MCSCIGFGFLKIDSLGLFIETERVKIEYLAGDWIY